MKQSEALPRVHFRLSSVLKYHVELLDQAKSVFISRFYANINQFCVLLNTLKNLP